MNNGLNIFFQPAIIHGEEAIDTVEEIVDYIEQVKMCSVNYFLITIFFFQVKAI